MRLRLNQNETLLCYRLKEDTIESVVTVNDGDKSPVASSDDNNETMTAPGEGIKRSIPITDETESLLLEREGSLYRATKAQKRWVSILIINLH